MNSGKGSQLKITGGKLKGLALTVPPGIIRPAMNKMRESIFAILGDLSGASFLDLFSGSGIIAIEAASRGALYIEAVESDRLKRKTLKDNMNISPARITCRFMPVELYIKRARRSFDFIFCDPPYNYKFKKDLINKIVSSSLMEEKSLFMIHRPKTENVFSDVQNKLALKDIRAYGNSIVDFLIKK